MRNELQHIGGAISYLQAYLRFCAAFGLAGIYNFGRVGASQRVVDDEARARDRRRALTITAASLAVGLLVGVAALLMP